MSIAPPTTELAGPPSDLDELVDWFDRFSARLVLLDEESLPRIRTAVEAIDAGVRDHIAATSDRAIAPVRAPVDAGLPVGQIAVEHRRFLTSLAQLWWFYRIVESDDHGGHRQALGQYGRLLAEALKRHRADERGSGRGKR